MPFATSYKLQDLPVMVYEDATVRATIKLSGDIAVRLADTVPIIHATNRGLETYCRQTEEVVKQLYQMKLRWSGTASPKQSPIDACWSPTAAPPAHQAQQWGWPSPRTSRYLWCAARFAFPNLEVTLIATFMLPNGINPPV